MVTGSLFIDLCTHDPGRSISFDLCRRCFGRQSDEYMAFLGHVHQERSLGSGCFGLQLHAPDEFKMDGCAGRPAERRRCKSVTVKAQRATPTPSHAHAQKLPPGNREISIAVPTSRCIRPTGRHFIPRHPSRPIRKPKSAQSLHENPQARALLGVSFVPPVTAVAAAVDAPSDNETVEY